MGRGLTLSVALHINAGEPIVTAKSSQQLP